MKRCALFTVLLSLPLWAGTSGFAFVIQDLGPSLPIVIYQSDEVNAEVGFLPDGRAAILFSSAILKSHDRDLIAFLYLHEIGHVRQGHASRMAVLENELAKAASAGFVPPTLRMHFVREKWDIEFEADAWAIRAGRRTRYDVIRGAVEFFRALGSPSGSPMHPRSQERLERMRALKQQLNR